MGEDIQALLEKIQREGIEAAEAKASEIERDAQARAKKMIDQARDEAHSVVARAQAEARKEKESSAAALVQASRDVLLTLRDQISKTLTGVCAARVAETLTPEKTARLIADLVTAAVSGKEDIVVGISGDRFDETQRHLLGLLGQSVKKGIVLKADHDIKAGFFISFDAGKSQFDFSDASLAEYLGRLVKPELSRILQESVTDKRP